MTEPRSVQLTKSADDRIVPNFRSFCSPQGRRATKKAEGNEIGLHQISNDFFDAFFPIRSEQRHV